MLLLYLLLLLSYFLYLLYTVNQFSFTHFRYCVSTFSYKHMPQCKFSLYLKKAGLASRNIVHFLKKVILRCIGLCFNYHHLFLKPIRSTFDPTYTCRIIVHGCLLGHYYIYELVPITANIRNRSFKIFSLINWVNHTF